MGFRTEIAQLVLDATKMKSHLSLCLGPIDFLPTDASQHATFHGSSTLSVPHLDGFGRPEKCVVCFEFVGGGELDSAFKTTHPQSILGTTLPWSQIKDTGALLMTDGGHKENLGLLHLLRQRKTRIIVVCHILSVCTWILQRGALSRC